MKTVIGAMFIAFVIFYLILASNYRVIAVVVPYCFDAPFGAHGSFKPCSEIDRYYYA